MQTSFCHFCDILCAVYMASHNYWAPLVIAVYLLNKSVKNVH